MKKLTILCVACVLCFPVGLWAQHEISAPPLVKGFPGDTISVPLNLTFGLLPPNPPISAYGLQFEFPHHLLQFDTTITTGTLTANWFVSSGTLASPMDSVITVGGFSITPITTSGVLIICKFIVKPLAMGQDSLKLFGFVDNLKNAVTRPGLYAVPSPPVIRAIQNQAIDEGGAFIPLQLDDYVSDAEDPDSALVWTFRGNTHLAVSLNNRVLSVQPPTLDWNGSETITLRVTDPDLLYAEMSVVFTVQSVNDPPIPGQLIQPAYDAKLTESFESLTFKWHRAKDMDVGEIVHYTFVLSPDETFSSGNKIEQNTQSDTQFVCQWNSNWSNGTYFWKVIARDQSSEMSSPVFRFQVDWPTFVLDAKSPESPTTFALQQNFPNPFNAATQLIYQVPKSTFVTLTIYSLSGHQVCVLVDGIQEAGHYSIEWNGKNRMGLDVASGVYLVKMQADHFRQTKKLTLLR